MLTVGPKCRTEEYNEKLSRLLQYSKPLKARKAKKTVITMNSMVVTPGLKLAKLAIEGRKLSALADTGSSHCLLTKETFLKLQNVFFEPVQVTMKVAGNVMNDNVIGLATLTTVFFTKRGEKVPFAIEFYVAHVLNGYDAIIGANFLMNPAIMSAMTPSDMILSESHGFKCIPLFDQSENAPQLNYILTDERVAIPAGSSAHVRLKIAGGQPGTDKMSSRLVALLGNGDGPVASMPHCLSPSHSNTESLRFHGLSTSPDSDRFITGSVTNLSDSEKILSADSVVLTVNHSQLKAEAAKQPGFQESNPVQCDQEYDSIDERILAENTLVDSSVMDKMFSHKDCEINPKISPDIQERLKVILAENQDVFAKSKLDVGKFKEFVVQLDIDQEIPPEKQRFMSEEKTDFCNKTFDVFEQLGLVQECHTPKTVSNLVLVPKYEGLRDLTKASTYLAQVKGVKNTQFRIVQDLRRINAATKNVKKTQPKLPEQIFQKLRGKIVSSVDINQAYWHIQLAAESRPYTCFYLKGRIMQFNRMAQGLTSAPACWDEAMKLIFSPSTMKKIKRKLPKEEAGLLPDSFDSFFDYYQDDSWIFSDDSESHLIHVKAVLMAFSIHDIRISPSKSTFFAENFKILGVAFSPLESELSLDKLKAESILSWEKPDSLYTLQSRLYALNYWSKFIPYLSELKFPLNQMMRSGIFSWTSEADEAWENIKAIIAMDIRLTVPHRDEPLLITTDASKVACSCILWVLRNGELKVAGCYSKLFSHADSLKNIHFKETYALVQAFTHFRPYLLNSTQQITVFTDARSLIWVSRNREHSIACNGLVNKLASLQLEIPHQIYSVPSEVNYLADLLSRAFSESRFLDKNLFSLSKVQAGKIPPLTNPCILDESALYQYFTRPLQPEKADGYPRKRIVFLLLSQSSHCTSCSRIVLLSRSTTRPSDYCKAGMTTALKALSQKGSWS